MNPFHHPIYLLSAPYPVLFFPEKEGFTYYFWTMSLSEIWMVDNLWTIYNLAMLGDVPSHTALQKKLYLLDEWLCQHHTWHLEQRVCDLSLVVVWVVEWLTVWAFKVLLKQLLHEWGLQVEATLQTEPLWIPSLPNSTIKLLLRHRQWEQTKNPVIIQF